MRDDGGWTLAETIIVIAIILVLTGTVGLVSIRYLEQAKKAAAKIGMETIALALDAYYLDCGDYPSMEQGLIALIQKPWVEPVPDNWKGPYLIGAKPKDPWGNHYLYRIPGGNGFNFELISYGADGRPGGAGNDEDIHYE
jgi:general secretion pathway protein G